jgi:hypothetical protein
MESRNRLCRIFKGAARFVMNTARKRRQIGGETPTPDRESLTEFGNELAAQIGNGHEKGAPSAPFP